LQARVNSKIAELSAAFLVAYQHGDDKQALDAVVKWQFLLKLQRDVTALEESLF
jgi:hypothetical protein